MNPTQPGSFQYIALDAIRPSATNPRKNFDPAALEELTQSIREMGITVPILIRPRKQFFVTNRDSFVRYVACLNLAGKENLVETISSGTEEENQAEAEMRAAILNQQKAGFEIVFGERRYLAAKAAGQTEIRAEVRDLSDDEAMDLQLVENLQRADLHPVEEAEGYRALMAVGASAEDVAKKAGKTTAHVQKLLKLLQLELPVKTLFHAGYLTLGHALLLARLTPPDQDRAVRNLLNANHLPKKEDMAAYVDQQIKDHAKYRTPYRLIRSTEAELRSWIESNILLTLDKVPWSLGDAKLLPEAGACTTCPKRTGTNIALFADMTAKEDVCMDAACFGAKHKALQASKLKSAAEAGKPLLKLATKSGYKKIEGEVSPKMTLKQGQWVKAAPGSCEHTQKGMLTEDPGTYDNDLRKYKAGDTVVVCANQACTVHEHRVEGATPGTEGGAATRGPAESYETRERLDKEWRERELLIREAIYRALRPNVLHKLTEYDTLFAALEGRLTRSGGRMCAPEACVLWGWSTGTIDAAEEEDDENTEWDDGDFPISPAVKTVLSKLRELDQDDRTLLIFDLLNVSVVKPGYGGRNHQEEDRAPLWKMANDFGVDAGQVELSVQMNNPELWPELQRKEEEKKSVASGTKVAQVKKASSTPAANQTKVTATKRAKTGTPIDRKSVAAGEKVEVSA